MSSTNRGAERQLDDFYETPAWCVEAILPHLGLTRDPVILDPFAGAGAILSAALVYDGFATTRAIELNPLRAKRCTEVSFAPLGKVITGDAFEIEWPRASIILTNPPYSLALESVRRAYDYLTKWGTGKAVFLLRLAFLESKERNQFLRTRMPDEVFVLPRRPAFINGKTDSCAYAWFVWGPEAHGESKLSVLEAGK